MPEPKETILENWKRVQAEVHEASATAGTSHVEIIGVSKYVGPELTALLVDAGCRTLGENRPQSLWEKHSWFAAQKRPQPAWHLIGHLQRNKVRRTLPMIDCIHSVDSLRLAQAIHEEALRNDQKISVLAEVNVSADASKTGMQLSELEEFVELTHKLPGIALKGLMAMSTHHAMGDQTRREFAKVRELRDALNTQYPELNLRELSMGMSNDFREAILEGATMVRIGSNLWKGLRD